MGYIDTYLLKVISLLKNRSLEKAYESPVYIEQRWRLDSEGEELARQFPEAVAELRECSDINTQLSCIKEDCFAKFITDGSHVKFVETEKLPSYLVDICYEMINDINVMVEAIPQYVELQEKLNKKISSLTTKYPNILGSLNRCSDMYIRLLEIEEDYFVREIFPEQF